MFNILKKHVDYKYITIIFLVMIFNMVVVQNSVMSQTQGTRQIQGVVLDEENIPVIGASVLIKGTTIGVSTDLDGKFTLQVPAGYSTLTVSSVGMTTQDVSIGNNITIVMISDEMLLQDVVVVGYGKQAKATVTGSISAVGTKELVQSSQANISNALVGRLSGLTAVQRSGEPGKDQSTLRIRGIGSFATDSKVDLQAPLVMVDGIETPNFNAIDPNEIDNISILKDASATAVYGVRGANGVILITTKRGINSRPKVSYSSNFAISGFTNLREPMNAYDWASSFNEAISYDGYITGNYTPKFTEEELEKYRTQSDPYFYPDTDWVGMILKKNSYQTQHNINISGGTDRVKYFTSVGFFSQDGMYNNTNYMDGYDVQVRYNRYNIRSNFDFQMTKDFSVAFNFSNQMDDRKSPNEAAEIILANAFAHPPTSGPGVIDGKLIDNLDGRYNFIRNPLIGLTSGQGHVRDFRNQMNLSLRFDYKLDVLTKGLSTHALISYQNFNLNSLSISKQFMTYKLVKNTVDDTALFIPQNAEGPYYVGEGYGKNRKMYFEYGFDYSRKFGNHNLGGLLLYNQSKYFDPSLLFSIPNSYQGIVGRLTYDYNLKYLFEANIGYNGTENFIAGKRFGFFPAFSAGWVISEESFYPKNEYVSYFKLRGSYGEVGNDKIGGERFLYRPTAYFYNNTPRDFYNGMEYYFGVVGTNYSFFNTSAEGKIGNPDLTWERARKWNIGVDISFWKDKFNLTADIFGEQRDNILSNRNTLPIIVGANLPAYNLGRMQNGGIDGELMFRDKAGKLNYWLKGIFTFARNKILFMDEVNQVYPYMQRTGQRFNQYFGYIAEGFYNTWEEVNDVNRPVSMYQNNKIQPGDVKYKDVNGDGIINTFDMVPIGYSDFPEISYGLSLGGNIHNFDFSLLFQGASNVSFRASKKSNRGFQEDGSAVSYLKDYSWTPERYASGAEIKFPHLSSSIAQQHNYQPSTLWIRDASYLRLKNFEIGYSFTGKLLEKMNLSSTRLFINGTNLFTWDNLFPGEDPEIPSYNDADYEPYPIIRTINFGININFN